MYIYILFCTVYFPHKHFYTIPESFAIKKGIFAMWQAFQKQYICYIQDIC